MTMITDSVFKQGNLYTLNTLPKRMSDIYDTIPNLSVGDLFKYTGSERGAGGLEVIHQKTGIKVTIHAARLLDSNRFYHSNSRSLNKTALMINYTSIVHTTTFNNYTIDAGTVFDSYEKVNDSYVITLDTGEKCRIPLTACSTLCDKEFKGDIPSAPQLNTTSNTTSGLTLKRSVYINGIEFSSSKAADTAEKFVTTMSELIKEMNHDEKDIQAAIALASSLQIIS